MEVSQKQEAIEEQRPIESALIVCAWTVVQKEMSDHQNIRVWKYKHYQFCDQGTSILCTASCNLKTHIQSFLVKAC